MDDRWVPEWKGYELERQIDICLKKIVELQSLVSRLEGRCDGIDHRLQQLDYYKKDA